MKTNPYLNNLLALFFYLNDVNIVNPRKAPLNITKEAHANWMGGVSWDIKNPINRLRIAASSCFFGEPQYYHRDHSDTLPVGQRNRKVRHNPASRLSDRDVQELRDLLNAVDPEDWRGLSPKDLMEKAIDEALEHSVEETLKVAVTLRNEEHIRVTAL